MTSDSGTLTVAAWVRGHDRSDYRIWASKTQYFWEARGKITTGVFEMCYKVGGSHSTVAGTTDIIDGQWHRVAFSRDSTGTLVLYVDGVAEATVTGTENPDGSTYDLNVGRRPPCTSCSAHPWKGWKCSAAPPPVDSASAPLGLGRCQRQ